MSGDETGRQGDRSESDRGDAADLVRREIASWDDVEVVTIGSEFEEAGDGLAVPFENFGIPDDGVAELRVDGEVVARLVASDEGEEKVETDGGEFVDVHGHRGVGFGVGIPNRYRSDTSEIPE